MTELSEIQLAMCKVIKEHGWPKVGAYPDRAVKRAIKAAYDYNWPPLSVAVISANGETLTKEQYEKWSNKMELPDYDYGEIYKHIMLDRAFSLEFSFDEFVGSIKYIVESGDKAFCRWLTAIKLKYQDGMTYKLVGREMGVSLGRVRQMVYGGVRRIINRSAYLRSKTEVPHKHNIKASKEFMLTDVFGVTDDVRVTNILKSIGVKTCGDVISMGRESLLSVSNCGKKSIKRLEADMIYHFNLDKDFKIE